MKIVKTMNYFNILCLIKNEKMEQYNNIKFYVRFIIFVSC